MRKCSECDNCYYDEAERAWMCKETKLDIEDPDEYPNYTADNCPSV